MTRLTSPSTRIIHSIAVLAVVFMAVFGGAGSALAEGTKWKLFGINVTDLDVGKTPTLVLIAQLENDVKLPYKGSMRIPNECDIVWVGEVFGGDPSEDIIMPIEIEEGDEYNTLSFTMTKSSRVQFELTVPESWILARGGIRTVDVKWELESDIPLVGVTVQVPADAHAVDFTKGAKRTEGPGGLVLYTVETKDAKAGTELALKVDMAAGPEPSKPGTGSVEATGTTTTVDPTDPDAVAPAAPTPSPLSDVPFAYWLVGGALIILVVALISVINNERAKKAGVE